MRRILIRAFLVACTWACGPTSDLADNAATDVPIWTVHPETRIGSIDDPEQSLTRVTQVLFAPSGEIVIPQEQDHTIRVFDAAGRLLREIGRRGEGPGEFGAVNRAGFLGDTLYVGDNGLGRVTFFDIDGRLNRSMPWKIDFRMFDWGGYRTAAPSVLLPDRTGLIEVGMIMRGGSSPPATLPRIPFLRADSAGEDVDTLAWQQLERPRLSTMSAGGRDVSIFWTESDAPLYTIAADGSGIVVVDRHRAPDTSPSLFSVTLIGATGDTVFSRTFLHQPIPTPASATRDVAGLLAERLDRGQGNLTADRVERELRSADLIPATLTPVTQIATGTDGTIWLKLASDSDVAPWLVLGTTGEPVGRVELRDRQRIMAATGDRMAALELDELDVPFVVIYRLGR